MEGHPKDEWQTHVEFEILDATIDKERLLQISLSLGSMFELSLIPEDIALELFNSIDHANKQEIT